MAKWAYVGAMFQALHESSVFLAKGVVGNSSTSSL